MPTPMKNFANSTFTLLLAAFVAVGLSACAEGGGGEGADTTMTDTAMTTTPPPSNPMGSDSVSLRSTNQLLQGGVTSIAANEAVQNIEGWQEKLGNVNASGQAQTAISNLTDALGQLSDALQGGGQPNMEDLTQSFDQINQSMSTLSQNAQSLNLSSQHMTQFQSLQQTLSQVPQMLGGGGM